jgi:hypothetical protein
VQVQPGCLHVGVDLALEENAAVVINEKAQRLDHFSLPQDRGVYDYFLHRVEGLRQCQKHRALEVVVAMEPSNYFWELLAKELEEKTIPSGGSHSRIGMYFSTCNYSSFSPCH